MTQDPRDQRANSKADSPLAGPPINPAFAKALDELVATARRGQRPDSQYFNPSDDWLIGHMRIFQDLAEPERGRVIKESNLISEEAERANSQGNAASRSGPDMVFRLDSGGLAFYSQLGVARQPDRTQYFIDGFPKNRDSIAFSTSNQALFAEVFDCIVKRMDESFAAGDGVVQTDRQIADAPGRSFHARQLLFGTRCLQLPYMWRQLTFELPESERQVEPDILEVSIPNWLEDVGLPEDLRARVENAGLAQLIFKAPTKGLSLHLGFDYVGEHKMGPLSVAMFLVKEAKGLAVQAALSVARMRTLDGGIDNAALITVGPSLHGKSTLTIMIELADSDLAGLLGLAPDPSEGVYPMNDDIVLLQPLAEAKEVTRGGRHVTITHGIDGTENNFYAMPFGLTYENDPIAYDVLRGTKELPNTEETLENVVIDSHSFTPDYLQNPVRNMRMILSRSRLLARKGTQHLLKDMTDGQMSDYVHVPMEHIDRVLWQGVMRQNTVIPPLRRLSLEQYIRVLMYGEAVQMGAAAGAIGRPYVEYFSDPFIIGLEDDNANLMYDIARQMSQGGQTQEFYVFNTGGVGADTNEAASGPRYKKIPRELTLMLQEALLRRAVAFEYDETLRSEIAVAIVNSDGEEVLNLRTEWLPELIYGEDEYVKRISELSRRRYYGLDPMDKAGILRYTKVKDAIIDISDIPAPANERELAWLLSFHWHVDQACNSLSELAQHRDEGRRPNDQTLEALQRLYESGRAAQIELPPGSLSALGLLGLHD